MPAKYQYKLDKRRDHHEWVDQRKKDNADKPGLLGRIWNFGVGILDFGAMFFIGPLAPVYYLLRWAIFVIGLLLIAALFLTLVCGTAMLVWLVKQIMSTFAWLCSTLWPAKQSVPVQPAAQPGVRIKAVMDAQGQLHHDPIPPGTVVTGIDVINPFAGITGGDVTIGIGQSQNRPGAGGIALAVDPPIHLYREESPAERPAGA